MKPQTLARCAWYLSAALTRLPWTWQRWLADGLAKLWRWRAVRESRITWCNLEIAFPHLSNQQRTQWHRDILRSTARQTLEMLYVWTHPPKHNLTRLLRQRHGEALYDAALASGKGVIIAAPHFGNWELLNQWLASRGPVAIVYAPPKKAAVEAFLQHVRGAENIQQIPAEGPAVRQILKVLKEGGAVGILPDQQPKRGDGVFVPFFGVQALTMTLVNRLAQRTEATVLYGWCERIGADLQFALHIEPAPRSLADPDIQHAVSVLNSDIERIARRDVTQYQWTYNRYNIRPPEEGN